MFIDTHIHLSHKKFDGITPCVNSLSEDEVIVAMSREDIINKLKQEGFAYVVDPGIDIESNYRLIDLAGRNQGFIYAAVGIHPTRVPKTKRSVRSEIVKLAAEKSVVAIGELGLDYHHPRLTQHRLKQKSWFKRQLTLA